MFKQLIILFFIALASSKDSMCVSPG